MYLVYQLYIVVSNFFKKTTLLKYCMLVNASAKSTDFSIKVLIEYVNQLVLHSDYYVKISREKYL